MQIKTNSNDDSKIFISKHNFVKQVPDIYNHMKFLNPFKLIKGKNSGEHTTHIYSIIYFLWVCCHLYFDHNVLKFLYTCYTILNSNIYWLMTKNLKCQHLILFISTIQKKGHRLSSNTISIGISNNDTKFGVEITPNLVFWCLNLFVISNNDTKFTPKLI